MASLPLQAKTIVATGYALDAYRTMSKLEPKAPDTICPATSG
ncbi:hypothetical protein V1291_002742 [Nitrobacteraceae bacterium AZCC 1564]